MVKWLNGQEFFFLFFLPVLPPVFPRFPPFSPEIPPISPFFPRFSPLFFGRIGVFGVENAVFGFLIADYADFLTTKTPRHKEIKNLSTNFHKFTQIYVLPQRNK